MYYTNFILIFIMMLGYKAPNYDTYGLFRATHSHVYAPLRSVLNMCHWHIAPYPIFAYRGIIIIVLTCKLCITINYIPYSIFIAYLSCIIPVKYSIAYVEPAIFIFCKTCVIPVKHSVTYIEPAIFITC